MQVTKRIKVIVSMIGLDGHTTGAEVVARILRDAGMEVVYLGVNQTSESIVRAALHEDIDAIGISSHASNFNQIEELVELLRINNLSHVTVICGGNIPKQKAQELKRKGVTEIFPPGSSGTSIVEIFQKSARGENVGID
jgi:methylmalonyl-CoA mutase C-terminal domain/subunit